MHKVYLAAFLTINTIIGYGQPFQTIFKWDSAGTVSLKPYGEMFIKGTSLNNVPTLSIGGRVGFLLNRKLAFGCVGAGFIPQNKFIGLDISGNQIEKLDFRLATGGVFFEYIHKITSPVHISFPISFMIGKLEIVDSAFGNQIESSRALMIEPGINLNFNISKILIIGVSCSYRITKVGDLLNINNQDASGFSFGLVGRFSNF